MNVTQKSPKHFRYTFVSRIQNLSLDIIDCLYRANDIYVTKECMDEYGNRVKLQRQALTRLRLLCFICQLAYEQGCILARQFEQISRAETECSNLVGAWINSDRKRLHIIWGFG